MTAALMGITYLVLYLMAMIKEVTHRRLPAAPNPGLGVLSAEDCSGWG